MRDNMLIYRSFYEAVKELKDQDQIAIWNAVFELGLNNNQIELTGIQKTIFTLIKPQIEANIKRFQNGKTAKTKQTKSKTEAKQKQNKSKTEANNNYNNNINYNIYRSFAHLSISEEEFNKLLQDYKKEEIDSILDQIENYAQNKKFKSLFLTAKNWLKRDFNQVNKVKSNDDLFNYVKGQINE